MVVTVLGLATALFACQGANIMPPCSVHVSDVDLQTYHKAYSLYLPSQHDRTLSSLSASLSCFSYINLRSSALSCTSLLS